MLAVCALIAVARRQTLRPLAAAAAGVVLLLATVVPAKILIGRSGPGLGPVAAGGLGVFPSGDTSTSSVCYGLAVLLLVPVLPARLRAPAVAAVAAVCLLVGLALVWCDYHWFTDVLACGALSGIIIQVCLRLAPPPAPGPARSRMITVRGQDDLVVGQLLLSAVLAAGHDQGPAAEGDPAVLGEPRADRAVGEVGLR